jgi:Divergent InlB B-repeat domain
MRERALRRALIASVAALAAAGALSATASASTRTVIPLIQGAGKVAATGKSCSQGPGVTNAAVFECPKPWVISLALQELDLVATPAAGWTFAGWSNCQMVSGNTCTFVAPTQNVDLTSKPLAKFVDSAPPAIAFGDVVRSATSELTASVSWDAGEPNVTSTCSVDGAAAVACTSPYVVTGGEGMHRLNVTATDANGFSASKEQAFRLVDTRLDGGPADGSSTRDQRAVFEVRSESTAFECSLDGEPFLPCDHRIELNGLADGRHTLKVRAVENGVADLIPARRTWTVDTTPPETVLMVEDGTPTFSYVSTEPGSTFACSVDGVAIALPTCPITRLYGLAPGPHEFSVRAIDRAGNADPVPARYRWTVAASEISTLTANLKPTKHAKKAKRHAKHHRRHARVRKGR